jgi:hypothetical protein
LIQKKPPNLIVLILTKALSRDRLALYYQLEFQAPIETLAI